MKKIDHFMALILFQLKIDNVELIIKLKRSRSLVVIYNIIRIHFCVIINNRFLFCKIIPHFSFHNYSLFRYISYTYFRLNFFNFQTLVIILVCSFSIIFFYIHFFFSSIMFLLFLFLLFYFHLIHITQFLYICHDKF